MDRIKTLPVLLIVTFRPEFDAPWVGQPHVTSLTLNRLGEREAAAIIDAPGREQGAAGGCDGGDRRAHRRHSPVRGGDDQGGAGGGERGRRAAHGCAVPSPALAVPASLHASLMARLDRLGPAKEVAQIGSAIGREFSHALLAAVARKPEAELGSALDRLIQAGLLFRQGVPPHASYLFKHALVQDAAYGTLLREPRRALHARIAETLESQFAEIAESQPETAGASLHRGRADREGRGPVGQGGTAVTGALGTGRSRCAVHPCARPDRDLARHAGAASRADQASGRAHNPLIHVKGYAAPETKAAAEQARLLIEQAEALGEPAEDPLLLFSVLYGFWVANYVAFNGDVMRELAAQFLALAEKQRATVPLMIGHRLMGLSLLCTGDIAEGRAHFDQAIALYDPAEHRPLATRFGQDVRVAILSYRSLALWLLGYPDAALRDAEHALKDAREIGQAATLMYRSGPHRRTHILCGNYAAANAQAEELVALAEEKGALFWKATE